MGWLLDKLNLAVGDPPDQQVNPDDEGISLEEASDRAFILSYYSLWDEEAARKISAEVTDFLKFKWQSPQPANPSDNQAATTRRKRDKDGRHKALYEDEKNRALQIDMAAYSEIQPYKELSIKKHLENAPFLDDKTLILWYIEDLVMYAIDHNALHIAIGVGKILFNYSFKDVQRIYEELNDEDGLLDEEYRRIKKRFMDRYYDDQGKPKHLLGALLKLRDVKARNVERRFVARANSRDSFEFVKETLYHLTPLKPDCDPFPEDFYNGSFEKLSAEKLESHLKVHAVSNSADAVERERMHALIHPRCLFGILNFMNMDNPKDKLEIPVLEPVSDNSDAGRPPTNFEELYQLSQKNRENVKKTLKRNDMRRDNFSYESVQIEVNNKARLQLSLQKPTTIPLQLELEEGESVITIQGKDEEGELPLGIHFVSWNRKPVTEEPIISIIRLKGKRRLEFLVEYQTDGLGYPTSATVNITYFLEPLSVASLARQCNASLSRVSVRKIAAGAIGFLIAAYTFNRFVIPRWTQQATRTGIVGIYLTSALLLLIGWGLYNWNPFMAEVKPDQKSNGNSQVTSVGKSASDKESSSAATKPESSNVSGSTTESVGALNPEPKIKVVKYREIKEAQARREKSHPSSLGGDQDDSQASNNESRQERATSPDNDNSSSAVEPETIPARSNVVASSASTSSSGSFPSTSVPESSSTVASTRSKIVGTVKDNNGLPLSDAKLQVTNRDLGSSDDTSSSKNGMFAFPDLEAGLYNLMVIKDGFQSLLVEEVAIRANETLPIDLTLEKPVNSGSQPASTTKSDPESQGGASKDVARTEEKIDSPGTLAGRRRSTGWKSRVHTFRMRGSSSATSFRSRSRRPSKPIIVVNESQVMCVRLDEQISSETSQDSDRFKTTVIWPVSVNNRIVIPEGSTIIGRVSKRVRAANSNGILVVKFVTLSLPDNVTRSIDGELSDESPTRDHKGPAAARSSDKRQMAFVGDASRGTSIVELPQKISGAGINGKQSDSQRADVKPKGTEAVVEPGAEFCVTLRKSVTLPVSGF